MMLFVRVFGEMNGCLHTISTIVLAKLQGLSTLWQQETLFDITFGGLPSRLVKRVPLLGDEDG